MKTQKMACHVCNIVYIRQTRSIKSNIKINGEYICHSCKNKSESYINSQKISHPKTPDITMKCACGTCIITKQYLYRKDWKCRSCTTKDLWQNKDYAKSVQQSLTGRKLSKKTKTRISESSKKNWEDDNYRNKVINTLKESKSARSSLSKKMWLNPTFVDTYRTKHHRLKMSHASKKLWCNQQYRHKVLNAKSTPEFKAKMAIIQSSQSYKRKLSKALQNQPKVSSLQSTLYSLLDDMGVEHYREYNDKPDDPQCTIGPWSFDCVIPRDNHPDLLIECQGEFIHNLPHKKSSDKAKYTYWEKYLSANYALKYLWEHQFAEYRSVETLIRYWVGIDKIDVRDFAFNEIIVKECSAKQCNELLSKYHYLRSTGRGGSRIGAFINNKLISVCVFSPLPRQNINIHGLEPHECRDLSRLCIHPNYQKKNFASWFISRSIKSLPPKYKAILSYADTTFNHVGTVYKASNFLLDGEVKPEYWYVSENGWVMHKKTLYNKAINLGLSEKEYASSHGYIKTHGLKKLRYLYRRKE